MNVKEAAEKWGMEESTIRKLCINNKIDGVEKINDEFIIPDYTQKPLKKSSLLLDISVFVIGIALISRGMSWVGGGDHFFFGLLLFLIGSTLCAYFHPHIPNVKEKTIFNSAIIIALVIAVLFYNGGSSNDSEWNDLSEVEKENAKWAYEQKKFIDSLED